MSSCEHHNKRLVFSRHGTNNTAKKGARTVATARERLLQALTAIISQPYTEEGKQFLKRLLNSYRVQAKSEQNSAKDLTARDTLADKILSAWRLKSTLDREYILKIISPFRMQLKINLNRAKTAPQTFIEGPINQPHRSSIKEKNNHHENAYFRDSKSSTKNHTAIGGGPQVKSGNRGQCPKCRSAGIVVARAYGGEDYYTCIYCGYQAYLKSIDAKLDLPMAPDLLGHDFGEPELDGED